MRSVYQYTPDQLLSLRSSPLVQKPATLPPAEEWMGPALDQTQKRANNLRGKSEGSFSHNDRFAAEGRQLSKTIHSPSGEIVLGPPKTSFASSSIQKATHSDSPHRSAFGSFGNDGHSDYFSRSKFGGVERNRLETADDKSRDQKVGLLRSGKDETNIWLVRSGKNSQVEDDRSYRAHETRYSDRDAHEGSRKLPGKNFDSYRRDPYREIDDSRRNNHHSSRPSWQREDDSLDMTTRDSTTDSLRSRDWRDGTRLARGGLERESVRKSRPEQEPEWMDDVRNEHRKDRHNAQDIEQWKASMKAREMEVDTEVPAFTPSQTVSGPTNTHFKKEIPLSVEPSLDDKFLSSFGDSTTGTIDQKPIEEPTKARPGRNQKSSKFTGFFGPQTNLSSAEPEQMPQSHITTKITSIDTISEDKAGFERILQMLGAPLPSTTQASKSESTQAPRSPPPHNDLESRFPANSPPPILSPRSRKAHDLETLLGLQSPREGSITMNKDSEFLLNLLRPKEQTNNQAITLDYRTSIEKSDGNPSQEGYQNSQHRSSNTEGQHLRFYDDHDQLNSNKFHQKTTSGHHSHLAPNRPLHFDDSDEGSVFPPQFSMGIPQQSSGPPGLHRPPGFENTGPPPGFPPFLHQQRGPNSVPPPPGFTGPSNRALSHQQFPPGLIPNMNSLHLSDRGAPPYNLRHVGPTGPGAPPPGLLPSAMSGAPPHFPMPSLPPESYYSPSGRPPSEFGDVGSHHSGLQGGSSGHYRRLE